MERGGCICMRPPCAAWHMLFTPCASSSSSCVRAHKPSSPCVLAYINTMACLLCCSHPPTRQMRTWLLQQEREPGGLAAIMQQRSAKSLPTPQKGPRRPARPPQPAPAGTNTALASAEEAAAAAARSADQHTNKRTGIVAMGGVAQPVQKRARRACGYNLFVADVISRHREQGTGKKTITLAGKLWREAGPEVQAQFNAKARAEEGGGA